ncbi:MAG: sigma 54-interacting transcriptional regulator [Planctomycetota bacterium]
MAVAQGAPELAIGQFAPVLDGSLEEWPPGARISLAQEREILGDKGAWAGSSDGSLILALAFDPSHLFLGGRIEDDQWLVRDPHDPRRADRVELHFRGAGDDGVPAKAQPTAVLVLWPQPGRCAWEWVDDRAAGQQASAQLGGIDVQARRLDATHVEFEAAIPFHQLPGVRPGALAVAWNVVLHDHDPGEPGAGTRLAWGGLDPAQAGFGQLRFALPGPLVGRNDGAPLLSGDWFVDLPYLLVPLCTLAILVLLLRAWPLLRSRVPWLRPTLLAVGVLLFVAGSCLPGWLERWRDGEQVARVEHTVARLADTLSKLEAGTLASYRGASRDRAVVQLLGGEAIARQRYTSYRPLAQIVPEQFGPPLRQFDDLPVRPYWLPLTEDQPESFQFDPPLHGSRLHVVLGRPFAPSFTFAPRDARVSRLDLAIDFGGGDSRREEVDLDRPFADGASLGRDHWEVCVIPVTLARDLRALTVSIARGGDYRLVGISLEGALPGRIEPVMLGTPTRSGVLTDLRGPYPADAGIELAPGATAKVTVPAQVESPQRLWFLYRAIYPGVPTAVLGAKVAEIVLHFGDGRPKSTILLEHQVSVFYELAFRNTRDDPPADSPASIELAWVDESKERHVNLGYPFVDLPADAVLEAIEFRNVAEYRMHFRSVVFVNERAAAPMDPADSPLRRDGGGQERRLDPLVRAAFADTAITLYRDGRLSESTLPVDARADAMYVPRAAAAEPAIVTGPAADGSRRVTCFLPLRGDGWDGAVVGVAAIDADWSAAMRTGSRWGLFACLLSVPFLLVLLSELLAAATSLRLRLLAVTSLASLAPLVLLSLVLVQVLEGGHAGDVESGMRGAVRSALEQFDSQKQRVQASAQQWLAGLVRLAQAKVESRQGEPFDAVVAAAGSELEKLLVGQLPPEWNGGALRLEWQPEPAKGRVAPRLFRVGDDHLANSETPARLEPGVFMHNGHLFVGVRAEQAGAPGHFVLTAARPVDGDLLGALAPGHDVLLTDARGYPLAASAGRPLAGLLLQRGREPIAMAQRERALTLGLEQRRAVVERVATADGAHVFGSEVLRDLNDTPRALLTIAQPDQRATLDLAVGRIPVRAFFLLVAGCLVVLSVFLSVVVSGRISRPIERLERGAWSLSKGQLDTRVAVDDGGQIGRLTRAFNQMAEDLQARLQDLQVLNRTMGELAGEHDEGTTVDVLRRFCQSHTPADSVQVALADLPGQQLVLHRADARAALPLTAADLPFAAMVGPFVHAPAGPLAGSWAELAPASRSLVGLPIVFGGQTRGLVVLGFARRPPLAVDLDLLGTVVAQAAVAFERCQLQALGVHDPVTGAFTPEYFRRRVVDEVALAQQRGRQLVLMAVALGDGERRPRGLRRFAALLREQLPRQAATCHAGNGQFTVAVPGCSRAQAEALLSQIGRAWDELVRQLPENEVEEGAPGAVVVQFPEDAASAEFLFEALRARLLALATPGASAMESDESLQRAGVTAISPAMREVYGALRRVAPTNLSILLEGETGVGKEVLANLVHRWSRRAGGPMVRVHCAALSETLLASELFGHEKGAFTGADRRKIGRFEQADGGTLFLDEVGEIPLDVQVKLLRVLQEGEVDRVGGSEPVKVDVRVVAATNRDIARMVQEGQFREDLYYRLQGMVVKVPPLRERKQELASLVEHFRAEIVAGGHAVARTWSTDALDELFRQEWPGNIRQLRNTVFRAMVMARGEVVQLRDLQAVMPAAGAPLVSTPPPLAATAPPPLPAADPVSEPRAIAPLAAACEPLVDLSTVEPGGPIPAVPPLDVRLEDLRQRIAAAGRYSTQIHMQTCGLSHRTALRDLQALVAAGLIERVGSRRGAFYRPSARG